MGSYGVGVIGRKIGRLTVLRRSHADSVERYVCSCSCGKEVTRTRNAIVTGRTNSCGCERAAKLVTHGMFGTPEYRAWVSMRWRCEKPQYAQYKDYGGRGIKVCDRWQSFQAFLNDVGMRPSLNHSIDRRNNDGNYEPGNVRWATRKEQAQNRRKLSYPRAIMARNSHGKFTGKVAS